MKLLKKGALAAALPMAVLLAGTLNAQPAAPATDPAPVTSTKTILSSAEMKVSVKELEGAVRVDTQHVQHLQAVARKEKDVIKLSCVNDKFVKLKAEANLFDKASVELMGVIDRDERHTSYQSVTQAAARVHKMREEAEQCVGEKEITSEDSGNSFTPPTIPDDPTTGLPFDEGGVGPVEPPGYASPYT